MRAWVRGGLAGMCVALSSASWALGLGEITVESYLNQPLRATITLVNPPTENLNTLSVGLASAADYDLVGLDRATLSVPLAFEVVESARGPVVRVSSERPVRDPVMRMLVEVVWANGRVLREYTVFLDPPTVPSAAPAPRPQQPPAQAPGESAVRDTPAPTPPARVADEPSTPASPSRPTATPPAVAQRIEDGEYGPVRSGETLWGIASEWSRGTGYSVNQVMLAIQQANPDAFNRGNINSLKRGAILRLPSEDSIRSISADDATAEVLAQAEAYELMRLGLASRTPTVAAAPSVRPAAEPAQEDGGDAASTDAPAEEPASPVDAADEQPAAEETAQLADQDETTAAESASGRLELVPPVEASEAGDVAEDSGSPTDTPIEEQLARTQEDLANAEQQNEYLEQRIEELQSELEAARQAPAAVADTELAEMQQRLAEQRRGAARDDETPWYLSWWAWILLLVVLGGLGLWFYRRREAHDDVEIAEALAGGAAGASGPDAAPVRRIQDEAEEILRVLDSDAPPAGRPDGDADVSDDLADRLDEADLTDDVAPATTARPAEDDIEAQELQADDPEVKLDLARAYFAMGDKEAARSMLEEVLAVGTEEQQAEARNMLDEF